MSMLTLAFSEGRNYGRAELDDDASYRSQDNYTAFRGRFVGPALFHLDTGDRAPIIQRLESGRIYPDRRVLSRVFSNWKSARSRQRYSKTEISAALGAD